MANVEMTDPAIGPAEVAAARAAFEENEPRDLFYRAATELVDLALRGACALSVAEALAVLLQTWNREYYRFRKFSAAHFADIHLLIERYKVTIHRIRKARIEDLKPRELEGVVEIFQAFETVLGPVGAAKTLHLLAPRRFPLWDRAIAEKYKVPLGRAGSNGQRYWQFMLIAREQCLGLRRGKRGGANPLKSIDEYNYCKYTKGWIQ
jgi:hypothetical protein